MSKIDDTVYPGVSKSLKTRAISSYNFICICIYIYISLFQICPTYRKGFTNPRPDFEQFMKEFDTHFGAKWDPFGAGQIIEWIDSFLHLMLPGSSLA